MRVTPVTAPQLEALERDPTEFERLIGAPIPAGWPEFPEAVGHTLAALRDGAAPEWSMHLFFSATGELVGSGGYHGPPADEAVEIGYEIAPAHRGRGYATAAARNLVDRAVSAGVRRVEAHTLAALSPSTGVLAALGFQRVGDAVDSDDGPIWEWHLRP